MHPTGSQRFAVRAMLSTAELVNTVLPASVTSEHEPVKVEAAILIELYEALNG